MPCALAVYCLRRRYFTEWLQETQDWPEIPKTFRSWSDYEDKSGPAASA